MNHFESAQDAPSKTWWQDVRDWVSIGDRKEWLKDMKKNLGLVASIIATMTFQFAVNPPGGVFQADPSDNLNSTLNHSKNLNVTAGQAVLAAVNPDAYLRFLASNTLCFLISLSVCLSLVSGFPLNHRIPTWALSIGMFATIISLSLTYLFAVAIVTPSSVWGSTRLFSAFGIVILVGIVLMGTCGFIIVNVMRLCFWLGKKSNETNKKSSLIIRRN